MDYRIEAMEILLVEDCIMERYHPLLPYREALLDGIRAAGCRTKSECLSLSDDALRACGLPDDELVRLFRRFLVMYDVKESKLRSIEKLCLDDAKAAVFRALFLLPGVKETRAELYFACGYGDLAAIASAAPEEIIQAASGYIAVHGLDLKAPLPKEVRTHIAVAKVLTGFAVAGGEPFADGN